MRIHVCTELNYGGIESQLLEAAKTYSHQGRTASITFWALGEAGYVGKRIQELGFTVKEFGLSSSGISLKPLMMLIREFIRLRPKEVFTHGFEANLILIPMAKFFGVRCIVAEEIGYPERKRSLRTVLKVNYALSKFLTVQSGANKTFLVDNKHAKGRRIKVVHPPVQEPLVRKSVNKVAPYNEFVFLGRLEKIKNINFIIEGFRAYTEISGNRYWKLKIYGAGSLLKNLVEKTEILSLNQNITFEGMTSEPQKVLLESDWLIMASESEGFGIVIIEAMQNGIPVLSPPVGIAPSVVENGINGFIFANNSIDRFQETIQAAISISSSEYKIMSENARNTVHGKFSGESYVAELDGLAGFKND